MPPSISAIERGNPPPRRKSCAACIKAKRRCSQTEPTCLRCSQRRIPCRYLSERPQPERRQTLAELQDPIIPLESSELIPFASSLVIMNDDHFAISEMTSDCQDSQVSNDFWKPFIPESFIMSNEASISSDALLSTRQNSTDQPPLDLVASSHRLHTAAPQSLDQISVAIRTRMQYAIDEIFAAPRRTVLEGGNPWSHSQLYRDAMPRSMQDAQACCALYLAKNHINGPVILRTICSRASELVAEPLASTVFDLLAQTQALLLYTIIRLLDGDIYARAAAEREMSVLERAALALLPLIEFEDPDVPSGTLSLYPLGPTREFWANWVLHESARRTVLMVFYFLQMYNILRGELGMDCDPRMLLVNSWTLSAHLWEARDAVEFAQAWTDRKHFLVKQANFDEVLRDAQAEDLELYGKILLSSMMGIEEFEGWMISRGGTGL